MKQCLIDKITTILHQTPPVLNLARKKVVAHFIVALINSRKVQFHAIARHLNDSVKVSFNETRIENFFREVSLHYLSVATLLLSFLPATGNCRLCIDRPEWNFGKCEVNILVITVGCGHSQLPFYWELLANKSGNAATQARSQLMQHCINLLGKDRIGLVLGDREFVGHMWFTYLKEHGINILMRLPRHHTLTDQAGRVYTVSDLTASLQQPRVLGNYQVDGVWGNVWLKKLENGDYLFLVGTVQAEFMGQLYRKRWTIEACFHNLKSRGVDLSATHVTCLIKLKKLVALTSIAYGFCLSLGCFLHRKVQKIKTKCHGYKQASFSRHGLNFLPQLSRPLATIPPQLADQLALAVRWLIKQIAHYQSTKIVG